MTLGDVGRLRMAERPGRRNFASIDSQATGGFQWARWTVVGCLAWLAFAVVSGGSPVAFIFTPVAGPIGGWILGGLFYLAGGVFSRSSD